MDEKYLEQAARLEETDRLAGIAKARAGLGRRPDNFEGECIVCHEEIPAARLKTGAFRCIPCQEEAELCTRLGI